MIALLLLAVVSLAVHLYVLTQFLEVGSTNDVLLQHAFLGIQAMVIYIVFRTIHGIFPEKSSFVFLGLLLLKMVFGFVFIKEMGWYTGDSEVFVLKAVFLVFYMVYLIGLLLVSIPLILNSIPANQPDQ